MILISNLLEKSDIISIIGNTGVVVKGITDDSREVSDGYIFVCMPADFETPNARWKYKTNGNDYIPDAVKRGAVTIVSQNPPGIIPDNVAFIHVRDARKAMAIISAEFYGNPSQKLVMVGVTGTNGKTSTCYLTRSVFAANNMKMAVLGTIIQRVSGSDIPASMTTPEAHRLQKMLSEAVSEGMDGVIMEASSHALELGRVDGIKFDVAVFTNLTQDHLDFHKGMAGYLASKTKLFSELMKDDRQSYAVLNADDPASEHIKKHTKAEVITYGVYNKADLKVLDFQSTHQNLTFRVSFREIEEIEIKLQLLGDHNLYNALSAMGIGIAKNIDLEAIKKGLESVSSVPGRFDRVDAGQDFTVVVDYAHTPDALERVLKAARKLTQGRLITVFGCGGDRDKGKRPLMGRAATDLSDYSIITSDNPRSEDPLAIISQIQAGVDKSWSEGQRYETIPDRRSAIQRAVEIAKKGDMIVIAGKGHENYQIIGTKRNHFDDKEEAAEAIKNIN